MLLPDPNCQLCPRLVGYREANRTLYPDWHNGPVRSIGKLNAELFVLGLAPGLKGANRTGKPFTGDYAGQLLFPTLIKFGFAFAKPNANFERKLELVNCRIGNAVRCVPPQNKPKGAEIRECSKYLINEIGNLSKIKVILALGTIAHNSVIAAFKLRQSQWKFSHNASHDLSVGPILIDSYHCSRYNTNTGRLTEDMFYSVFERIRKLIPIEPV